jgi:hypothetical protein
LLIDANSETPISSRILRDSNQPSSPTLQQNKKWPFIFKYPEERLINDPVLDKLSVADTELASGDLTKIVTAIFNEMRSYGDDL